MDSKIATILVVDDNEMNREVVARRLLKQGHHVVHAEDGRKALDRLEEQDFDLVLLDVMMPEMSGYEVLERIKADPIRKHIPVLMISAATEIDGVVKCIELGAEDYLPKPFKPVLLNARVNACLEKKRLRDQEEMFLAELKEEKKRSEDLLQVILPASKLEELKTTNTIAPRLYEGVAVMFADVVQFTKYCDSNPPETVVEHLQALVNAFEDLASKYRIDKIKTIGDAFMCTGGLHSELSDPVLACVKCGMEMIESAKQLDSGWSIRVGIHVGPVMGGVVGHRQYLFDVWGDTVNMAARMEKAAHPDSIVVSELAWEAVKNNYPERSRDVEARGKGVLKVYDVTP